MTAEGSDRNAYRQTQVRQGNLKCEASNKNFLTLHIFLLQSNCADSCLQLPAQFFYL